MVQALLEFEKRTEYKVLQQFVECEFVHIGELMQGNLVIPGFVLNKMTSDEISCLNSWLDGPGNQAVILPSWIGINLAKLFHLSLSLEVLSMEEVKYFGEIPVSQRIEGKYKDKLFEAAGDIFGVRLRRDTGSGLITVVTLPLLDYKLPHLHEKFRLILQDLFMPAAKGEGKTEKTPEMFAPDDVQVHLLILFASGEDLSSWLSRKLEHYFFYKAPEDILIDKVEQLRAAGFIENDQLTPRAAAFVEDKKLKAFVRLIRERRESADGWKQ